MWRVAGGGQRTVHGFQCGPAPFPHPPPRFSPSVFISGSPSSFSEVENGMNPTILPLYPPRPLWLDGPFMKAARREAVGPRAGMADAAGRPLHARVSRDPAKRPASWNSAAIPELVRRGDAHGGRAAGRRRGDPLLRSAVDPEPMGIDWSSPPAKGPLLRNPIREAADVDRLRELETLEPLEYVMEAVRQDPGRAAPSDPADRLCRGPVHAGQLRYRRGRQPQLSSHQDAHVSRPGAWHALLGRLARAVTRYLNAQIAAGVQAVQLFDSWVGCLGPDDYRRYVLPHSRGDRRRHSAGRAGDPFRHRQSGLIAAVARSRRRSSSASTGACGWTTPGERSATTGPSRAISIRPCCLAEPAKSAAASGRSSTRPAGRPGHIFNLGHGVLPQTPVENVDRPGRGGARR